MSYGEENGIKSLKELFWRGNKWGCSQLMGMVVGFMSQDASNDPPHGLYRR